MDIRQRNGAGREGHQPSQVSTTSTQDNDKRLKGIRRWKNKLAFRTRLILLVVMVLLLRYVLLPLGRFFFDNHTMRGGELGRMVDTLGRTLIFRRTMQKRASLLRELGIQLPPMKDIINKKGIPNLPQAAVAEIMMRSKIRARQLREAELAASRWRADCQELPTIPKLVLQPNHGDFFRPVHAPTGLKVIRWDHYSMRKLIQERFPSLLPKFDRMLDKNEQTIVWSLCALYTYGGIVYGTKYRSMEDDLVGILGSHGGCQPTAVFLFSGALTSEHHLAEVTFMAASPRHPYLKRILDGLAEDSSRMHDWGLLTKLYGETMESLLSDSWDILTCSCSEEDTCCQTVERSASSNLMTALEGGKKPAHRMLPPRVYLKVRDSKDLTASVESTMGPHVEVVISETQGTAPAKKVPKVPISEQLNNLNCNAGWMCNRCLKNAIFGRLEACRLVCPPCYKKIICDEPDSVPKKNVTIDISVRQRRRLAPGEQRIPRIIHQTWFEEPTVDRYPQLARLQNSWKTTGWEYRFYSDATMREYIADNYPARFLDAFDSVIPGAFKADFFRYLVLLKDGGVYSDVDIMLDVKLDSFVTPTMSFFVPRDIVGDYAGENFCLWNGLLGAAPGHPFMARAVEALLNNIVNRVDYYDMESDMCRDLGSSGEVWKMRALTILSLSGPCLLGHAVNEVLGRSSFMSKYEPGWLTPEDTNGTSTYDNDDIGDALLLIASRADMGALRFSDVDRNMMVASTGMTDLLKDPIRTTEEANESRKVEASHIHYSKFEHANDIFGAESIYMDNLVSNEVIKLRIIRKGG